MFDNQSTTIGRFLDKSTNMLREAGIESSRLDCLILLEDDLSIDRAHILAHLDQELSDKQLNRLVSAVKRRSSHEPLAYIRHKVMFYGREFHVSKAVLIPRPETENLIDLLLKYTNLSDKNKNPIAIADIGTGSGCIGITAALEIPSAKVDLYDIDKEALDIAAINADIYDVHLNIYCEDLLSNDPKQNYDIIVTNLPYVPTNMVINKDATFEPRHAIFAGPNGLKLYDSFWQKVKTLESKPKFVITESLPSQHEDMIKMASNTGYELAKTSAFGQLFKLN